MKTKRKLPGKGDPVVLRLFVGGIASTEHTAIVRRLKNKVWVDSGCDDPYGPFDVKTGRHLDPHKSGLSLIFRKLT